MAGKKRKRQFLESAGALNKHPERIKDSNFKRRDGFFDPLDKVQAKYEMLRAHGVEGQSVTQSAERFGYTRESFYQNLERLRSEGILGLADRKRGRQGPVKLTGEVLEFIKNQKKIDPKSSGAKLTERVKERFGVELHRRTVEKAIGEMGGRQKKTEGNTKTSAPSARRKRRKNS